MSARRSDNQRHASHGHACGAPIDKNGHFGFAWRGESDGLTLSVISVSAPRSKKRKRPNMKKKKHKIECDLYTATNPRGDICQIDQKPCNVDHDAERCEKVTVLSFIIKDL